MTHRQHPLSGEPILFAPGRAARPRAFGDPSRDRCPFCPGHEEDTPPALAQTGDPWRVRTFANKYPPADGAEVIVESPHHDHSFAEIDHAAEIMQTYVDRYRAHSGAAYVSLFKNEGARAGASIPHVHSQVVPIPFVPPRIARESAGFRSSARCPLCVGEGAIIDETPSFLWLAPRASAMPYQQWVVPRRHVSEMTGLEPLELSELAMLLRHAAGATQTIAHDFNWMFMNFPREPAAHFYIELFPRLAVIAGFELGTGTFVEIIDPDAAAQRLRETR